LLFMGTGSFIRPYRIGVIGFVTCGCVDMGRCPEGSRIE